MSEKEKAPASAPSPCESCSQFAFDEDAGDWVCLAELDEDELYAFMSGSASGCASYRLADDYELSKRQARPF